MGTLAAQKEVDDRLRRMAEVIVSVCLLGGTSIHTAYAVAGLFIQGIQREWDSAPADPATEG